MCIDSGKNMSKATKKTRIARHAAAIFGLGGGITKDDAEITGSWLPTNQQVIRCCFTDKKELPNLQQNKNRLCQNRSRKSHSILSQRKHSHGINKKRL